MGQSELCILSCGKQQQRITLTGGLVTLSLAIYLETHDISDKSMDKT